MNAPIGALVIGDEILVGKRKDKHFEFLVAAMAARGLRLAYCEYHGDDPARLSAALRRTFAPGDIGFSFGGIGATPDDHTRRCAGDALGVPLAAHPEGERELRARFGAELTPQRLRMVEFPLGAQIVPNPVNRVPGFSLREHHFVPGFPQMAWPMVEWVLDNRYRHLADRDRWAEASIIFCEDAATTLIQAMDAVGAVFPVNKAFRLPSMCHGAHRLHLVPGVRGDSVQVEQPIEL